MPALRCATQGAQLSRAAASSRARRVSRIITRAAEPKQDAPAATPNSSEPAKPTYVREFDSWGARIVESDGRLTGPEDQKDPWEGENMEAVGKIFEKWFVPGLVVLGLICGGIAARSYNEDADVFIKTPTGPDADIVVVPAQALAPAPVVESAPAVSAQ
ncbi:hypothetical protein HYH03_014382 [Edaphochlamys debaryana]|uniref:Uncharacterized protein n=1 Tax=Edaphochlamys debaryana TaxID=47281 RepID=A0A835XRP4_9CHLO|nr:hypothetical protein HYH03_014382 [Edaphochlamys debaryana]|eukprot:KAG2487011.1 hypothetical protein HYH03_014382 [Edaphochlamys debaryana]